jgi:hypothetical protein
MSTVIHNPEAYLKATLVNLTTNYLDKYDKQNPGPLTVVGIPADLHPNGIITKTVARVSEAKDLVESHNRNGFHALLEQVEADRGTSLWAMDRFGTFHQVMRKGDHRCSL